VDHSDVADMVILCKEKQIGTVRSNLAVQEKAMVGQQKSE
jgi:hypothetical protein